MRKDISIHTRLFLSLRTFVLLARQNIVPSSLPTGTSALFPTHLFFFFFFFKSRFCPKHPHNTLFPPLTSFLSTLEYPVFHLAAQWAVWMCLFRYVTSFLELLPPAQCHCITYQLLHATQWESLFSAFFEARIWSPNGDGIKLGADNWAYPYPTPPTQVSPSSILTCYIKAPKNKGECVRFIQMTCTLQSTVLEIAFLKHNFYMVYGQILFSNSSLGYFYSKVITMFEALYTVCTEYMCLVTWQVSSKTGGW